METILLGATGVLLIMTIVFAVLWNREKNKSCPAAPACPAPKTCMSTEEALSFVDKLKGAFENLKCVPGSSVSEEMPDPPAEETEEPATE